MGSVGTGDQFSQFDWSPMNVFCPVFPILAVFFHISSLSSWSHTLILFCFILGILESWVLLELAISFSQFDWNPMNVFCPIFPILTPFFSPSSSHFFSS